MNVRLERNKGHDADVKRCLLMTHSGHSQHEPASRQLRPPCKAVNVGTGAFGQDIQDHTNPGQFGKAQDGTLKTYKNYPHGMITTQAEAINADQS